MDELAPLTTSRLILRPLTLERTKDFHAVFSNPITTAWSMRGTSTSEEAARERMNTFLRDEQHPSRRSWLVYVNEDGPLRTCCIGHVSLVPRERSGGHGTWELGYFFLPQSWGKGYAYEACVAARHGLVKDMQDVTGPKKIIAWVSPANAVSVRMAEKLGFKKVAHRDFPGGKPAFLGGTWREDGIDVFETAF